mgnify:CR=1 FL=1
MAERPGIGVLVSHVVRDAKALLAALVSLTKAEGRHAGEEVAVGSQACEAVRRDVYPEDWALWKRHCQG